MGWLLQQRCYNLVIASCAQSALRFYLCTALETEISHEEVFADVCMAVPSKISFAAAPPETPKHKSLGGHSNGVTRLPFWSSINCKQSLKIHFFSLFPNIINVHTADTALGDDTEIAISLCTWTAPHLLPFTWRWYKLSQSGRAEPWAQGVPQTLGGATAGEHHSPSPWSLHRKDQLHSSQGSRGCCGSPAAPAKAPLGTPSLWELLGHVP